MSFLVLTDVSYPKRLTFGFLTDVHREFVAYVRGQHGSEWRSRVDTAAQAYAFMGFQKVVSRLKREYADPESKTNAARLAEELHDVQGIMRQNIAEVLDRGEKLEREWNWWHGGWRIGGVEGGMEGYLRWGLKVALAACQRLSWGAAV